MMFHFATAGVPRVDINIPVSSLSEAQKAKVRQIRGVGDLVVTDDPSCELMQPIYSGIHKQILLLPWIAPDGAPSMIPEYVFKYWEDAYESDMEKAKTARNEDRASFRRECEAFSKAFSFSEALPHLSLPGWADEIFAEPLDMDIRRVVLLNSGSDERTNQVFFFREGCGGECVVVSVPANKQQLMVATYCDVIEALEFSGTAHQVKQMFHLSCWAEECDRGNISEYDIEKWEQALADAARERAKRAHTAV